MQAAVISGTITRVYSKERIRLGCLVVSFATLIATGQQAVAGQSDPAGSQRLAQASLDALHHGEDLASDEERLKVYREGVKLAEQAIALDDNNADAHFAEFANNGRILKLQGATANPLTLLRVRRSLNRVLEINPNHADALAARGGMYHQLPRVLGGSLSKAEADLKRALSIDPTMIATRIELARTYLDMGDREKALPLLEEARNLSIERQRPQYKVQAEELLAQLK